MSSQWLQLQTEVSRQNSSSTEDAIMDTGAVSVTIEDAADQPILEPGVGETPLWDQCIVKALYPASVDIDQISTQLLVLAG